MAQTLLSRRRPTLPHSLPCSTIGAEGLNFRVRKGNGCFPFAIAAGTFSKGYDNGTILSFKSKFKGQATRPISPAQLHTLPCFHLQPINVVVFDGSVGIAPGSAHLEVGFPLRCIQRLSTPHIATQRCRWRDNWYTRGASIPVLSY